MPMKAILTLVFAAVLAANAHARTDALLQRVSFPSLDGKTTLTGYLFVPNTPQAKRVPAIVMMHGRAGAYSSLANGLYDASTLSKRHKAWGTLWAEQGYVALMVDGFGPRGYPAGFPRYSYDTRPAELNEVTIRPLDAYGALAYLRARTDVDSAHIGLQGWSNGGSATLAAMAATNAHKGFMAAIAFYPACALKDAFRDIGYKPYAPLRVYMGLADEEVSPSRCAKLVDDSRAAGGDVEISLYNGASHGFDDPSAKRQGVEANAEATDDAVARAVAFFAQKLGSR